MKLLSYFLWGGFFVGLLFLILWPKVLWIPMLCLCVSLGAQLGVKNLGPILIHCGFYLFCTVIIAGYLMVMHGFYNFYAAWFCKVFLCWSVVVLWQSWIKKQSTSLPNPIGVTLYGLLGFGLVFLPIGWIQGILPSLLMVKQSFALLCALIWCFSLWPRYFLLFLSLLGCYILDYKSHIILTALSFTGCFLFHIPWGRIVLVISYSAYSLMLPYSLYYIAHIVWSQTIWHNFSWLERLVIYKELSMFLKKQSILGVGVMQKSLSIIDQTHGISKAYHVSFKHPHHAPLEMWMHGGVFLTIIWMILWYMIFTHFNYKKNCMSLWYMFGLMHISHSLFNTAFLCAVSYCFVIIITANEIHKPLPISP